MCPLSFFLSQCELTLLFCLPSRITELCLLINVHLWNLQSWLKISIQYVAMLVMIPCIESFKYVVSSKIAPCAVTPAVSLFSPLIRGSFSYIMYCVYVVKCIHVSMSINYWMWTLIHSTVNRVIQSVLTNYLWLLYILNHVLYNLTSDLGNGSQIRLNYLIREIYFKIVPEIHFVFNVKCWEISAQALNHIVIA